MRRAPGCDPPPLPEGQARAKTLFELDIQVVTPMFGGSAVRQEVDPLHPVTAKMVRGHLRYWWRACKVPSVAADELFREECELWGSTNTPAAVDVLVECDTGATVSRCGDYPQNDDGRYRLTPRFKQGYPAYALFPFQGKLSRDRRNMVSSFAEALEGVKFRVTVLESGNRARRACAGVRDEVEAALWCWVNFGGVGARTRRGCGSLFCRDFAPADPASLLDRASHYIRSAPGRVPWPTLSGARLLLGATRGNPMSTWAQVVRLMQLLRQEPLIGRDPGTGPVRAGRSRWPEADSLRRVSGRVYHKPKHPAAPFYPKADLGLPIVFHFKDADRGDPLDCVLQGFEPGRTRMASPVILKPLAVSDRVALPLVLLLNAPHVWDSASPGVALGGHRLTTAELYDVNKVIGAEVLGHAEAREAFMRFAASRLNAREVRLCPTS